MRILAEQEQRTIFYKRSPKGRVVFLDEIPESPGEESIVLSLQEVSPSLAEASVLVEGCAVSPRHPFFRRFNYVDYGEMEPYKPNNIELIVSSVSDYTVQFELWINGNQVSEPIVASAYLLDNLDKLILDESALGLRFIFFRPYSLRVGDVVQIRQEYLRFQLNQINLAAILETEISKSLWVGIHSLGSIVRADTINDIIAFSRSYPCLIDPNTRKIFIPEKFIIPRNKAIEVIFPQEIYIDRDLIPVNYGFFGVYVENGHLYYRVLGQYDDYGSLLRGMQYYTFEEAQDWLAFFTTFYTGGDTFSIIDFLPMGFGSGGGGGANKSCLDITNVEDLTITVTGGSEVPFITIFDEDGHQIIPEDIHFDFNNQAVITFGEVFSGRLCVI